MASTNSLVGASTGVIAPKMALPLSEGLFSKAFRSSPAAMVISRLADGLLLDANEAFIRLCGYPREQLIGRTSLETRLIDPQERKRISEALDHGQPVHEKELLLRCKDGDRWVLASAERIEFGPETCILWTGYDITLRKLAEAEVRNTALFLEEDPSPVLRATAEGKLLYANPASVELLAAWKCAVGTRLPELVRQAVGESLATRVSRQLEFRFGERTMSFVLMPLFDRGYVNLYGRDVTEQKQAEEARRLTEQRFRRLVEASCEIVWFTNAQGQPVEDSPSWRAFTGRGAEDWVGWKWLNVIHPDDRQRVQQDWLKALETPIPFHIEFRQMHHSGEYRHIDCQAAPILNADGSVREWVGMNTDITERKQAEEELRRALAAAEERGRILDAVFENVPEGLTLAAAPDARILRMSRYGQELTGKPNNVIEGIPLSEHTQKVELYKADGMTVAKSEDLPLTRATKCGEVVRNEVWVLGRPDGTRIPLLCSAGPIRNAQGVVMGGLTAWRDITDLVKAQEALRTSEQRFRVAQDLSLDGFTILSPIRDSEGHVCDFRWDYVNPAAARMLRHGPDGLVGKQFLAVMPGNKNTSELFDLYVRVVETGKPHDIELFYDADGIRGWFRNMTVKLGDGIAVCFSDITARKQAQESLEELVSERTAKLQELVGELEHFSYTITHDMRAPLRAMRGYGELMSDLCSECTHLERKEFLNKIMTSAERMDALIRDALSYSQSLRAELPLEKVDTATLLRGMLDTYPEFQSSRAEIRIDGDLPVVLANTAGLTQCFSNLLGNAVKFVRAGEKPEIRIRTERRAGWVRLWVEDKGIGISPSMLPRVFDMFSRGHKEYEGTGIGLALVRKVTQRMGGRVGVESDPGHGARFWIELKLASAAR